jgi:2,4-dienoyl-CoA reductase-like NADH-dependent reductase (Old Yellow Enzyme family)
LQEKLEMKIADAFTLRNGITLRNRLVKSAMSERLAGLDGLPHEGLRRLYRRWAEGGTALLVTGNVMIDRSALGESGNVVLDADQPLEPFSLWARAAQAGGAHALVQLNHPGRQSPRQLSAHPVAPSAVPMKMARGAFAMPRALEAVEIEAIVERFAIGARGAVQAGFDGVQIHGAHGYLVNQFLSPLTNLRDDAWGGDAVRRRRFLLEVVRAVRAAIGDERVLSVKLNSADFQLGGFDESESLDVVRALDGEGIDLLEVSGGTYETAAMFDEPKAESTRAREAFFIDYAEKVRTVSRTPLLVTGGFRTARGMNAALASGALDLVGLARPLAVEPDLPKRLLVDDSAEATKVKLATGMKTLDSLLQGAWYQAQISRIARGEATRPKLSRAAALAGYFMPRRAMAAS